MNCFRKTLFLICITILCVSTFGFIACNNVDDEDFEKGVKDYGQIIEEIDNTKISYKLNDFETLSSLYKCRIGWGFGKVSSNTDTTYIVSGERSAKIDVYQDGTRKSSATLNMPFLVTDSSFDISKLKNIIFDIYNSENTERNLSLSLTVGSYVSEKTIFVLNSGWNHIEYEPNLQDIEKHESLMNGRRLSFYFDRPGEIGYETYYIDNVIVNNRNYENFETVSEIDNKTYNISNGKGQVVISDVISHKDEKSLEFKNDKEDLNSLFNIKFNQDQIAEIIKGGAIRFYFKVVKGESCSASLCDVRLLVNGSVLKDTVSNYDLSDSEWIYVNLTDVKDCVSLSISVTLDNAEDGAEYSLFIDDISIAEKVSYNVVYYKETDVINEYQIIDTVVKTGYIGDYTESIAKDYPGYICQPITEQTIKTHNTSVDVKYYNSALGVPYYIDYYLAYTDNEEDGYMLDKSYDVLRDFAGATTQAVAKEYPGYFSQDFEQKPISGDGLTRIEIYYTRDMLVEGFETFELENDLVGETYDEDLGRKYFINGEEVTLFYAKTGLTKPSASIVSDAHSGNKALMFTNSSSAYLVWFTINLNSVQKQALKDGKIISFWYKIQSTNGQDETFSTTINSVNYTKVVATTSGEWKQVYLYNDYVGEKISFHFSGSTSLSAFNICFDDIQLVDAPEISYTVNHILVDGDSEKVIYEETDSGIIGNLTNASVYFSAQIDTEKLIKVDNVYYTMRYIEQKILTAEEDVIVNVYYDKIENMAYKVIHKLAMSENESDGYYTDDSLTQWLGGELGDDTDAKPLQLEGYTAKPFVQKPIAKNAKTVVEIVYERSMLVDGVELFDYTQAITDYEDTSVFDRKYRINGEYLPYYVTTGVQKPTLSISPISHSGNKSVAYICGNTTTQIWLKLQLNSEQVTILEQDGILSFWYKIVTTKQNARKTIRAEINYFTVSGGVYDFISATNNSEWHEYILTKDMIDKINDTDNKVISWHLYDCDGTIIYIDDIMVKEDPRPAYKVQHYLQDKNGEYTVLYKEQIKHGDANELTSAKALSINGFEADAFEQVTILSDNSAVVRINYLRDMLKETFEEMQLGAIELEDSLNVQCEIVEISHKKVLQVIGRDKSVVTVKLTEEQRSAIENMGTVVVSYTFSTDTRERYAFYNLYVNGKAKSGLKPAYSIGSGLDVTTYTIELYYDDLNDVFDKLEFKFEFRPANFTSIDDDFILRIDDIEVFANNNSYYLVEHYLEDAQGEFTQLYKVQRIVTADEQTTTLAEPLMIDGYYSLDFDQKDLSDGEIVTVVIKYRKSPEFVIRYYVLGDDNEYSELIKEETLSVNKPGDLTDIDVENISVKLGGINYVYSSKDFTNVAIEQNGQIVNVNCDLLKETVESFENMTEGVIEDTSRFGKIEGGNIWSEAGNKWSRAEVTSSFAKDGNNSVRYYVYNAESVTVKAKMSSVQLAKLTKYDTVRISFSWYRFAASTTVTLTPYIGSLSGTELAFETPENLNWNTLTITGAENIKEFISSGGLLAIKIDLTGYKYAYIYIDEFIVEFDQTEKLPYTVKHIIEGETEPFATEKLYGRVGDETEAVAKTIYSINGSEYSLSANEFSQVIIAEGAEVIITYQVLKAESVTFDFESDSTVNDPYVEHKAFSGTGYLTNAGENTPYSGAYLKNIEIATDNKHGGDKALKITNDPSAAGWGKLQIDLNEDQQKVLKEGAVITLWYKVSTASTATTVSISFKFYVNGVAQENLKCLTPNYVDAYTNAIQWKQVSIVVTADMLTSFGDKIVIKTETGSSGYTDGDANAMKTYNLWIDDITITCAD